MRRTRAGSRVFGAAAAGAAVALGAVAVAAGTASSGGDGAGSFIAAAHLPPLLTLPDEPVTLRYAIVCSSGAADLAAGVPCDGGGDVFVRAGHSGPFRKLPLVRGSDARRGRWFVDVPPAIASSSSGFSYYAVLRDDATGETTTLPVGGADAPQDSYVLGDPVHVTLSQHRFGETRAADARVVDARWGGAARQVGVTGGEGTRIGPSAFDVARDGTVTILDEINGRIVRWRGGAPAPLAVDVPPAIDDMSVGPDGAIYVVDGTSAPGETPLLRTFSPDGRLRSIAHLAERTWSQVRAGPDGPVVQEHPSEQWMPRGGPGGGRAGRPLGDGSRLVVLRSGVDEVRVARVVDGAVRESWRVRSATPLGEVQLAERMGESLVLVVKTYTEDADEYEVLVIDARGVARRFSLASAAWAEAAPLTRFRLLGTTLYRLGSTPDGAFVDTYDLGGAR